MGLGEEEENLVFSRSKVSQLQELKGMHGMMT